jgi:hypothetical protein
VNTRRDSLIRAKHKVEFSKVTRAADEGQSRVAFDQCLNLSASEAFLSAKLS